MKKKRVPWLVGYVWEWEDGVWWTEQELLEMGYHFVNGEPVAPPLAYFKDKVEGM